MTDLAGEISKGRCPDCGQRGFVLGPRGGSAQNIECASLACRSRFNVAVMGFRVMMCHRIGIGGQPDSLRWDSEPEPETLL